jgi:hypothetical protein
MPKFALLIEAINIHAFVLDCQDLSTIRGGSILLLEAPERWREALPTGPKLEVVTSGASRAVFVFEAKQPDETVSSLRRYFATGRYRYATVRVECVESCGDLLRDEQVLTARVRWAQLRAPSLSMAGLAKGAAPCEIDLVRPAVQDGKHSASTEARREYGRTEKQQFLSRIARLEQPAFCNDLGELAGDYPDAGQLEDKMAIFAVDGNSFGKTLRDAAAELDLNHGSAQAMYQEFDRMLREFREKFFASLVKMADGPAWNKDGKKRIELLMCGGDELKIAVPAWQGLWLAREFYRQASDLRFGDRGKKLEFAGALIFAHHKAPIHGLTALAEKLLEEAKRDRSEGRMSFLVMESLDPVGGGLDFLRRYQTPDAETLRHVCVRVQKLPVVIDAIATLKASEFPRRKTYQVLSDLRYAREDASKTMSMALSQLDGEGASAWRDLAEACGNEHAAWYHLAELWDYVPADTVAEGGIHAAA